MYSDKDRLRKFLELNKPFGLTEDDLRCLLYSEMIFTFLQIEGFRCLLLFVLKLPIRYTIKTKKGDTKREKKEQAALGELLRGFGEFKINKSDVLLRDIRYGIRNGLSHGLFWFDMKGDEENSKPHLHYPKDVSFKNPECVTVEGLFSETIKQSIYTVCLLNIIADWFS